MSCRTRAWVVAYQDQGACSSRSELAEFGDREDEAADSTLDARSLTSPAHEVSKPVSGVTLLLAYHPTLSRLTGLQLFVCSVHKLRRRVRDGTY